LEVLAVCLLRESSLLRCIEFLRFHIRHPSETVHGVATCMHDLRNFLLLGESSYSYVI
jgi:hypothetical protein